MFFAMVFVICSSLYKNDLLPALGFTFDSVLQFDDPCPPLCPPLCEPLDLETCYKYVAFYTFTTTAFTMLVLEYHMVGCKYTMPS